MLSTVTRTIIALLILGWSLVGCHHHKELSGDHPAELTGRWQLLIRSSCAEYDVKSDILILRPDGTFDQHVVLNNGKRVDLADQHWRYRTGGQSGDIALDKRLELFTPEHFRTATEERAGTFEVLLVELQSEPVIVLHPDSDCVYTKARKP